MARKTWLELVNAVMTKLREDTVSTVSQTTYSSLIGILINEAKREVEDAYAWNALKDTITLTTTASGFSYSLTGSGQRFSVIDAYNQTSQIEMHSIPTKNMNNMIIMSNQQGEPVWYNFNGSDVNGDTQVDVYPIPNGPYQLYFNLIIPQADLSVDTTGIFVPDEPVVLNAYARAVVERGEDGGILSGEAYALYKRSLANHIALDQSRQPDETLWVPV